MPSNVFRRWTSAAFTAATCVALAAPALTAQSIRSGFNSGALDNEDDISLSVADIGFSYNFYGLVDRKLWINNNGSVTLDGELLTFDQDPTTFRTVALNSLDRHLLAPFYADVDTRNSAAVTYGVGQVGSRAAFGVNWLGVGYFDQHTNPLNYFQLVMIDRSDIAAGDFDFEFNYGSMGWESGDVGGGVDGIGGDACARAGWAGSSSASAELPGSGECGGLLSPTTTTEAQFVTSAFGEVVATTRDADRYTFSVRNGQILGSSTVVPEPATNLLIAVGLAGIAVVSRRRRQHVGVASQSVEV
jgi:hypothetical protein